MTVDITTDGKRIQADIPWMNGQGPKRAKLVPGYRPKYNGDKFICWTYPLTLETCHALRALWKDQLRISEALAEWYRRERAIRQEIERLRAGSVADLPVVREQYPLLWEAISNRPFQVNGAAAIAQARTFCLGDAPRLGKTYQALAAIAETGAETVLIACPKTACYSVWYKKILEFLGETAFIAQEDRSNRDAVIRDFAQAFGRKFLIINKEMIRVVRWYRCDVTDECRAWVRVKGERNMVPQMPDGKGGFVIGWPESKVTPGRKGGCQKSHDHKVIYRPNFPDLFGIVWDCVVLDECHHALASTKNVQSTGISQIRIGAMRLKTSASALKIALSGTPFRSKAAKAWGVMNWLRPDVFSSFWRFAEMFFEVGSNYGGSKTVSDRPKDDKAFQDTLRPFYLARAVEEVAPELEPIAYEDVELELTPRQARAYADMVALATAAIEGGTLRANGVLAELTRQKQLACSYGKFSPAGVFQPALPSNKLEWVLQFLDERLEADGKVVIATQFTKLASLFVTEISKAGWECLTITGESTGIDRARAQEEFQTGTPRVIVINMFAGGEAIDLSAANEIIFLDEPSGRDEAAQQAENRIRNLAKAGIPLMAWKLRSVGTIDVQIAAANEQIRDIIASTRPQALSEFRNMMRIFMKIDRNFSRSQMIEFIVKRSFLGIDRPVAGRICDIARQYGHKAHPSGLGIVDVRYNSGAYRIEYPDNSSRTVAPASPPRYTQSTKSEDGKRRTQMAPRGRAAAAVQEAATDNDGATDFTVYADKAPTPTMIDFADWLIAEVGLEFATAKEEAAFRNGVRLGGTLRMHFQQSDFNIQRRDERRAAAASENGAAATQDKTTKAPATKATTTKATRGKAAAAGATATKPATTRRGARAATAGAEAPF